MFSPLLGLSLPELTLDYPHECQGHGVIVAAVGADECMILGLGSSPVCSLGRDKEPRLLTFWKHPLRFRVHNLRVTAPFWDGQQEEAPVSSDGAAGVRRGTHSGRPMGGGPLAGSGRMWEGAPDGLGQVAWLSVTLLEC